MSTKLRSACDRCHETKVRCTGDMPCETCLAAKTLCFYSLSNPLGRPRGARGAKSRASITADTSQNSTKAGKQNKSELRAAKRRQRRGTSGSDNAINLRSAYVLENTADASGDLSSQVQDVEKDSTEDYATKTPQILSTQPSSLEQSPTNSATKSSVESLAGNHLLDLAAAAMPADSTAWASIDPNIALGCFHDMGLDRTSTLEWHGSDFDSHTAFYDLPWDNSFLSEQSWIDQQRLMTYNTPLDVQKPGTCSILDSPIRSGSPLATSKITTPLNMGEHVSSTGGQIPFQASSACSPSSCSCLQRHAELANDIRIPESFCDSGSVRVFTLDQAFSLAKQGCAAWHDLVVCPDCPYRRDQVVVRLALITMREIVQRFELFTPHTQDRTNRQLLDRVSVSDAGSNVDMVEPTSVMIGSVEVNGEERSLILKLLLHRTFAKINSVLQSLYSSQEKRKEVLREETAARAAGDGDHQESTSIFQTQKMINTLSSIIETLDGALG